MSRLKRWSSSGFVFILIMCSGLWSARYFSLFENACSANLSDLFKLVAVSSFASSWGSLGTFSDGTSTIDIVGMFFIQMLVLSVFFIGCSAERREWVDIAIICVTMLLCNAIAYRVYSKAK